MAAPRYIYKSIVLPAVTGFTGVNVDQTSVILEQTVNSYAEQGWQLLQVIPPIQSTLSLLLVFQREATGQQTALTDSWTTDRAER